MNNNIFIPKKLKVGFKKREDTYSKKLAYVIYYDNKNKLRKEISWEGWRDKKIEPIEIDNEPRSGFVLNRKVGGDSWSGWNHRNTYVRVYDPEGFEFEIQVPNLLYILQNTNSIKGKGLEGEFVYAYDGKELLLMPTCSPDYKELVDYNNKMFSKKKFKGKDMILGATYITNKNKKLVYMGRHELYNEFRSYDNHSTYDSKNLGKKYWFYDIDAKNNKYYSPFIHIQTLSTKIIDIHDTECYENYAEVFETMSNRTEFSSITMFRFEKINIDNWNKIKNNFIYYEYNNVNVFKTKFYNNINQSSKSIIEFNFKENKYTICVYDNNEYWRKNKNEKYDTIEELLSDNELYILIATLKNGKEFIHAE